MEDRSVCLFTQHYVVFAAKNSKYIISISEMITTWLIMILGISCKDINYANNKLLT